MSVRLLHRDLELKAVGEMVAEVIAGRPTVLVIRGRRGLGRTALLHAASAAAHEVGTVLLARCHRTERDFPFAMVRQLFDRPAPDHDEGRVRFPLRRPGQSH